MNAWTPVKVIDESLEAFGQGGVVHSAAPTPGKTAKDEATVDVKLDNDQSIVTFKLSQLQALA